MDLTFRRLGRIPFQEALTLQDGLADALQCGQGTPTVLILEHTPVYTLGRSGKAEHLVWSRDRLAADGIDVVQTTRGGDVTFHGPGQLVVYPVLDVSRWREDVRWYVDCLEELMIRVCAGFGVKAQRVPGLVGVWTGDGLTVAQQASAGLRPRDALGPVTAALVRSGLEIRKLGAIGVHLSRWVSRHGLALNLTTDLGYFDRIVPCGLHGLRATSVERESGRSPTLDDAADLVERLLPVILG